MASASVASEMRLGRNSSREKESRSSTVEWMPWAGEPSNVVSDIPSGASTPISRYSPIDIPDRSSRWRAKASIPVLE